MAAPIDFYFDFSSPFGYLAAKRIEAIAENHGRTVAWHPILLGFIFKITESKPLVSFPLKGEYSVHDMKRSAREQKIPFAMPSNFPVGTIAAARAVLWAQTEHPALATPLIHALYDAFFADDKDISETGNVMACAESLGIDPDELETALQDDAVKSRLKTAVDEAVKRGVFGSPFIVVDDEPFWGHDRLEQVSRWLETGGW